VGHIRLGQLPRTRKWQDVVGLITAGADAGQLARATLTAAEECLEIASKDQGLIETVWLLTQLPLAARTDDFAGALRETGLDVPDDPTLLDITGAFSEAVDRKVANGSRSDLGEMAEMAALEAVSNAIRLRTDSIFGSTPDDVRAAFSGLATERQFSKLARDFFGRMSNRCLGYFLSTELPNHIGEGKRFATLAQKTGFSKALETHCEEASLIVETFSGGWFKKTNWLKGGISRKAAAGYIHVAMSKLLAEFQQGAQEDD